jgi:hypothetical protein
VFVVLSVSDYVAAITAARPALLVADLLRGTPATFPTAKSDAKLE